MTEFFQLKKNLIYKRYIPIKSKTKFKFGFLKKRHRIRDKSKKFFCILRSNQMILEYQHK